MNKSLNRTIIIIGFAVAILAYCLFCRFIDFRNIHLIAPSTWRALFQEMLTDKVVEKAGITDKVAAEEVPRLEKETVKPFET